MDSLVPGAQPRRDALVSPTPHASLNQGAIFDPMGTGHQVYQGLAGMLIVEDDISDMLPLPRSFYR